MNGISTYNYNAEVLDHGCLSAEGDVGRDKNGFSPWVNLFKVWKSINIQVLTVRVF